MKRIFKLLLVILATLNYTVSTVQAQAPQKMTYQAVVRDASNNLVTNTQVGIEINILQGSATGTQVYTETQTPTTNVNGLLTIEIGGQTGFDTITWVNGPYFLETNIDPNNSGTYTITGVSQLLTVPYALHAKTAESITGDNDLDETNEIEMPTDASAGDMVYFDGTEWVKILAASEDSKVLTFCEGKPIWTSNGQCVVNIGDYKFGGVVFYIFQAGDAGYVEGETHGLVCTIMDISPSGGAAWGCSGMEITGADGQEIGDGVQNTIDIDAGCTTTGIAADLCANLTLNEYYDWYLPSRNEMLEMYQNKDLINAMATANGGSVFLSYYLTSTEYNAEYVYYQSFYNGTSSGGATKIELINVRAIRTF